jgi:hypothetical protein
MAAWVFVSVTRFTLNLLVDKAQELLALLAYRLKYKEIRKGSDEREILVLLNYSVIIVNVYSY